MVIIGNIALIVATLVFFALVSALFGKEPPRGGDAVVGYVWGIIILNLVFLTCMCVASIAIGLNHGFAWIPLGKTGTFFTVVICLLAAIITSALSGLFKYENGPVPPLFRVFSSFVPILIPLILILAATILLNSNLREMVSVAYFKWPLAGISIIGFAGISSGLFFMISENFKNETARQEQVVTDHNENNIRMIGEIDSCDAINNLCRLLIFTDGYKDAEVTERAISKLKTNPLWQEELVRLLKTDNAPEVFTFLASNKVDSNELFYEPIRIGLQIQAKLIREDIRRCSHPSHFYPDQFSWEIERVLRTVDKFSSNNVNYISEMKEIRSALDEPSEFQKPKFICIPKLEQWIKEHH